MLPYSRKTAKTEPSGKLKELMNNKKDITKELGTGKILPLVPRLSFPAVIAQLITFLYNIVDRIYVAKIASHGMYALAAFGIFCPSR